MMTKMRRILGMTRLLNYPGEEPLQLNTGSNCFWKNIFLHINNLRLEDDDSDDSDDTEAAPTNMEVDNDDDRKLKHLLKNISSHIIF